VRCPLSRRLRPRRRKRFCVLIEADSEPLVIGLLGNGCVGKGANVKELVQEIAKVLVDHPDEVSVKEVEGEQVTVLELRVAPGDVGKVIGKQGRTARSIRTLLGAAGVKLNRRFTLEILE